LRKNFHIVKEELFGFTPLFISNIPVFNICNQDTCFRWGITTESETFWRTYQYKYWDYV